MQKYLLQIENFLTSQGGEIVFYGIIALIVTLAIVYMLQIMRDERYEKMAFTRTYKKKEHKNFITDVVLKEMKENVTALVLEKGKPIEKANSLMNILVGIVILLGVFMVMVKQPVFAIVLPIVLLVVMTKITGLIKKSFSDYVMAQLPSGIDGIIRAFSGYSDLKTVLYEAGETLPQPMKGIFQDLSRRMQTEAPDLVIQEFMDKSRDIWIYCMSFNLLAYVEDANQKDVIENLRELKEIVDRDNREKKKQKMERKLTTSINYILCVLAFGGFVANLIFNKEIAVGFFFGSVGGIAAFLVGMTLLVVSIFSNLLIGSGKD